MVGILQNLPGQKKYADVISVHLLMYIMGAFAFFLPPILYIGQLLRSNDPQLLGSISEYYHSTMGDVFVGVVFSIGIFLIVYKGFSDVDNILSTISGFSAFGVALFPTGCDDRYDYCQMICGGCKAGSSVHFISAAIFFIILAVFCLFIFTKHSESNYWRDKWYFWVYFVSGIVMLLCIGLIFLYSRVLSDPPSGLVSLRPIFWLETIALWAFSISWCTKAKVISDKGLESNRLDT